MQNLKTQNIQSDLSPLPNDNLLDWSKSKAFADEKINVTENMLFCLGKVENIVGKRRKCWLPVFSPLPIMFFKGLFFRVVKFLDCVVELNIPVLSDKEIAPPPPPKKKKKKNY